MPEAAKSILQQLLLRDPRQRLGTDGSGAEQVKAHAFFEGISWDDVAQEQMLPPFLPGVADRKHAMNADCETLIIPSGTFSSHTIDAHDVFSDF